MFAESGLRQISRSGSDFAAGPQSVLCDSERSKMNINKNESETTDLSQVQKASFVDCSESVGSLDDQTEGPVQIQAIGSQLAIVLADL